MTDETIEPSLAESSPDYVMVPRKASDEMVEQARMTLPGIVDICDADIEDIYETMIAAAPPSPRSDDLKEALRKSTLDEFSNARRMRTAIVEARERLAKGRALWNGPCHECDAVLERALSAFNDPSPRSDDGSGLTPHSTAVSAALRAQVIEECAKVAEEQAKIFLSTEFATNQPMSSFNERFACKQVASAIRSLSAVSAIAQERDVEIKKVIAGLRSYRALDNAPYWMSLAADTLEKHAIAEKETGDDTYG